MWKKMWDWADGRKTWIGFGMLLFYAVLKVAIPDFIYAVGVFVSDVVQAMQDALADGANGVGLIGGLLAIFGIGHKMIKWQAKKEEKLNGLP